MKIPTSTAASNRWIVSLNGSVIEYSVATARNDSSIECERSSWTQVKVLPCCRERYQAISTTIDQPTPIRSRLAPVMLASASEHGDAVSAPGSLQPAPYAATAWPAFQAKTMSTAYSGSTAMNASTAI